MMVPRLQSSVNQQGRFILKMLVHSVKDSKISKREFDEIMKDVCEKFPKDIKSVKMDRENFLTKWGIVPSPGGSCSIASGSALKLAYIDRRLNIAANARSDHMHRCIANRLTKRYVSLAEAKKIAAENLSRIDSLPKRVRVIIGDVMKYFAEKPNAFVYKMKRRVRINGERRLGGTKRDRTKNRTRARREKLASGNMNVRLNRNPRESREKSSHGEITEGDDMSEGRGGRGRGRGRGGQKPQPNRNRIPVDQNLADQFSALVDANLILEERNRERENRLKEQSLILAGQAPPPPQVQDLSLVQQNFTTQQTYTWWSYAADGFDVIPIVQFAESFQYGLGIDSSNEQVVEALAQRNPTACNYKFVASRILVAFLVLSMCVTVLFNVAVFVWTTNDIVNHPQGHYETAQILSLCWAVLCFVVLCLLLRRRKRPYVMYRHYVYAIPDFVPNAAHSRNYLFEKTKVGAVPVRHKVIHEVYGLNELECNRLPCTRLGFADMHSVSAHYRAPSTCEPITLRGHVAALTALIAGDQQIAIDVQDRLEFLTGVQILLSGMLCNSAQRLRQNLGFGDPSSAKPCT